MRIHFIVFEVHILFVCRISKGYFCRSAHLGKESSAIKENEDDGNTKGEDLHSH
jgi:hypothetical protein